MKISQMSRALWLGAVMGTAIWVGGLLPANAATVTDDFAFYDVHNNVLASGSFSYSSALSGVLDYANLNSFSVSLPGQTYDLAFALSTSPYQYFAYNTNTNQFVPGVVSGFGTTLAGAFSHSAGFFFDALASQPNVGNNDGILEGYSPDTGYLYATSYSITQTPLPAALPLFAGGLGLLGFVGWRKKRKHTGMTPAAA